MTVSELIAVLQEFDGTEVVVTAMAPSNYSELRVASGDVYRAQSIELTEEHSSTLDPGTYNVVVIEW